MNFKIIEAQDNFDLDWQINHFLKTIQPMVLKNIQIYKNPKACKKVICALVMFDDPDVREINYVEDLER